MDFGIDSVEPASVRGRLRHGPHDFTTPEWIYVLLSVVVETREIGCLQGMVSFVRHGLVEADRNDPTGTTSIYHFLTQELSLKAKSQLCAASTVLATQVYDEVQRSRAVDVMTLLGALFDLSLSHDGIIDGWVAAEVVADARIDPTIRRDAALHLLIEGFRYTAGHDWWRALASQVSSCHLLAAPVMNHFVREVDPFVAIQILSKVEGSLGDGEDSLADVLRFSLADALQKARTFDDWQGQLSEVFSVLSPEVVVFVREVVEDAEMSDMLDLLPS